MTSRDVTVIDNVEFLDSLPADAFIVAASAGTNIIDYRGIPREEIGARNPRSEVLAADIPDIVAHRNRQAPAVEPVLKAGDQAPELNVLTWLDAGGKTERPALEGKIIVIDFWGIGCGPCVAGLPEVNAAAKHFAKSKIVIIGLHDSGGNLANVAEFAQRRGLAFPLAIDQPERTGRSFGATFRAFGIESIPACVVIDEERRVAYRGEFKRAIEIANQLAQEK
jgi:thiol-disulfide isomerase/thioredoxin